MKKKAKTFDYGEEEENFSLKSFLLKYMRYWPWFLGAVLFCLFSGYLYMRYSTVNFRTVAKIKIIDESERPDITETAAKNIWGISTINLDNEIEVLKSYRLLDQVASDLNLDVSYYYVGTFKTSEKWNQPFVVKKFSAEKALESPRSYYVELTTTGFYITDEENDVFTVLYNSENKSAEGLPFSIELLENIDIKDYEDVTYKVVLNPRKDTVMKLTEKLQVQPTNKKSDILALSISGESPERSEAILNTTIEKFNLDAIADRQAISKRTLDFIDERFIYLSGELDSIELGKQDYKQDNSLSYIEEDATTILKKKSIAESEVFDLQTQFSLSRLLKDAVIKEDDYSLLPSDIGLANSSINSMVANYNGLALQRSKLSSTVGENHPSITSLNSQLKRGKENILKTVEIYRRQLGISLSQLNKEKTLAGDAFSRIPEKEKMLRAIERQQSIKENLFVLLLGKREEAAINHAVTAPSVKIVDYAQTAIKPISPKKVIVYPLSLLLGMAIPFAILFIRFSVDSKIQERAEVEKLAPGIPILAEIPFLENLDSFQEVDDRSVLAESFRILATNVNFYLPKKTGHEGAQIIYVSSAIKGEGKTMLALNLSLAYSSLKKRVLLVGGDLRNPKLQHYFNINDNTKLNGLSDYLYTPTLDWRDCIHKGFGKNMNHKVCFSGTIPANPAELLAGKGFGEFIGQAKKEFDIIVVDTAPTLLVTDTLLIPEYADLSLFVVRMGFTARRLLEFSKGLKKANKLKNMVYVLNDVGPDSINDYNYGYGYGYGRNADRGPLSLYENIKFRIKKIPMGQYIRMLMTRLGLKP